MEYPKRIIFADNPEIYSSFFSRNNLLSDEYIDCTFVLTGNHNNSIILRLSKYYTMYNIIDKNSEQVNAKTLQYGVPITKYGIQAIEYKDDSIVKLKITKPKKFTELDRFDGYGKIESNWEKEYRKPIADFSDLDKYLQLSILDKAKIKFFDEPVTYGKFFETNDLYRYGLGDYLKHLNNVEIILTGKYGQEQKLRTINGKIHFLEGQNQWDELSSAYPIRIDNNKYVKDTIVSLRIQYYHNIKDRNNVILDTKDDGYRGRTEIMKSSGGSKASLKKYINGKLRCIYKIVGSRKEYIKYKGHLVSLSDYKKYMKI
jgi:hypothetical protein